jgi:hypothetical protein
VGVFAETSPLAAMIFPEGASSAQRNKGARRIVHTIAINAVL